MYGEGTNPFPFIIAAYVIGALGIIGYGVWLYIHRNKVQRYLDALQTEQNTTSRINP